MSPPAVNAAQEVPRVPPEQVAALQQLAERWLRRIAWGGDARRKTVRLEVGEGPLAGTVLQLSSTDGALHLEVKLASGTQTDWAAHLERELGQRGLSVSVASAD